MPRQISHHFSGCCSRLRQACNLALDEMPVLCIWNVALGYPLQTERKARGGPRRPMMPSGGRALLPQTRIRDPTRPSRPSTSLTRAQPLPSCLKPQLEPRPPKLPNMPSLLHCSTSLFPVVLRCSTREEGDLCRQPRPPDLSKGYSLRPTSG